MIDAEVVDCDWFISENLGFYGEKNKYMNEKKDIYISPRRFRKPVMVFNKSLQNMASDILFFKKSFIDHHRYSKVFKGEFQITISSHKNATAQAIWRSPSSLAIHAANPSYESLSKSSIPKAQKKIPCKALKKRMNCQS